MAHRLKFIIIGDSSTGKSALRTRFLDNRFTSESIHTIGVEFAMKTINVGDKKALLQIWDTAGQERFRAVTRSYYRGAHGCLLLYDITDRNSYNNVTNWLSDARAQSGPDMVIMLVGNKSDLQDARDVTFLEASRLAQENGMLFFETSAKTGEGVEDAFVKCSKTIMTRMDEGKFAPNGTGDGTRLSDDPEASSSSCSC
jgi:small GTP-binding protein